MNSTQSYTIVIDGSVDINPGPGGWAAIIVDAKGEEIAVLRGREPDTTNNRAELQAAIMALEWAANRDPKVSPGAITVTTDSQYVRNGMTVWSPKWKKNGWRTSDNKPVKNRDLWEELDRLNFIAAPRWHWVRGHAGHALNERADKIAREEMEQARRDASPFPDDLGDELLKVTI